MTFDDVLPLTSPTLVDPARLRVLWDTAQECAPLGGAVLEVGVYQGGTAALLSHAVPARHLILCDTFAGHPDVVSGADAPTHYVGRFQDTSLDAVRARVAAHQGDVRFLIGCFPHTIPEDQPLPSLCFAHVDVDLYESTRAAFEVIWPVLQVGGAIVCDDYGFSDCPGAHRAVQEFVDAHPDAELQELRTLQARVWKREVRNG